MRGVKILLPALLLGCAALGQDQPSANPQAGSAERVVTGGSLFIGSWELDPSRTKLGSRTIKLEPAGDSIRMVTPTGQYEFKIDGSEYPTDEPGATTSWKQIDANTWEVTSKENGAVASTSKSVMSPDGSRVSTTTTLQGDRPSTINSTYERQGSVSPAAGGAENSKIFGTWKQTRQLQPSGASPTLTYDPIPGAMRASYQGMGTPQSYEIRLDGEDHPVAEGGPPGMTLATKKLDDRSFEEVWKRDGQLYSKSTIRVSADGKQLTESQQPGGSQAEPSEFVYKKQ